MLPLGSALLHLASPHPSPVKGQPLPGLVEIVFLTVPKEPGQDMMNHTTIVCVATFVCSNLFCQHVTITSCTMASPSKSIRGTDIYLVS